jgi:hypothetical protein
MAYLLFVDEHFEQDTPLQRCIDFSEERRPIIKSRMLGFLSGHEGHSQGMGVSAVYYPGTTRPIVVGRASMVGGTSCTWQEVNYVAFIWDDINGMRNLQTVLTSPPYNLDLTGWELTEARAISEDGTVICGLGLHTVSPGNTRWEGWVATIGRAGPVGACCRSDLTCYESTLPACQGTYHGGFTCANTVCCHTPFADSDGDGDVDQMDFGAFQLCYGLTDAQGNVPTLCKCWDKNKDNKVDATDFTEFDSCWTGPDVPYTSVTGYPASCTTP